MASAGQVRPGHGCCRALRERLHRGAGRRRCGLRRVVQRPGERHLHRRDAGGLDRPPTAPRGRGGVGTACTARTSWPACWRPPVRADRGTTCSAARRRLWRCCGRRSPSGGPGAYRRGREPSFRPLTDVEQAEVSGASTPRARTSCGSAWGRPNRTGVARRRREPGGGDGRGRRIRLPRRYQAAGAGLGAAPGLEWATGWRPSRGDSAGATCGEPAVPRCGLARPARRLVPRRPGSIGAGWHDSSGVRTCCPDQGEAGGGDGAAATPPSAARSRATGL